MKPLLMLVLGPIQILHTILLARKEVTSHKSNIKISTQNQIPNLYELFPTLKENNSSQKMPIFLCVADSRTFGRGDSSFPHIRARFIGHHEDALFCGN